MCIKFKHNIKNCITEVNVTYIRKKVSNLIVGIKGYLAIVDITYLFIGMLR